MLPHCLWSAHLLGCGGVAKRLGSDRGDRRARYPGSLGEGNTRRRGLPLLFWTFAAPSILFVSSLGDATLTKPIVADILRVAVFVTALLSPIVVCLTAVGFAVGRRRRLPTFPRNRLRLRSRINLIPLVFVLLGVGFLLFCAMPTIGLGLLFGAEPHIFSWFIPLFCLWYLMIATAALCTDLVRAGLVVWWILVYPQYD